MADIESGCDGRRPAVYSSSADQGAADRMRKLTAPQFQKSHQESIEFNNTPRFLTQILYARLSIRKTLSGDGILADYGISPGYDA